MWRWGWMAGPGMAGGRHTVKTPLLDALSVQLDGADLEVDANSRDERRSERVLAEAQQAAGLADARVADEEELDLRAAG
ncbi:hypothetical protein O988_00428 [Pseudogymnoascus sp. VKM F-3808]|nr:hypothetical protein O988_00428 [Pseudogymnoascus sp. VKM F-3808]